MFSAIETTVATLHPPRLKTELFFDPQYLSYRKQTSNALDTVHHMVDTSRDAWSVSSSLVSHALTAGE